jgi:hypothetical protein
LEKGDFAGSKAPFWACGRFLMYAGKFASHGFNDIFTFGAGVIYHNSGVIAAIPV